MSVIVQTENLSSRASNTAFSVYAFTLQTEFLNIFTLAGVFKKIHFQWPKAVFVFWHEAKRLRRDRCMNIWTKCKRKCFICLNLRFCLGLQNYNIKHSMFYSNTNDFLTTQLLKTLGINEINIPPLSTVKIIQLSSSWKTRFLFLLSYLLFYIVGVFNSKIFFVVCLYVLEHNIKDKMTETQMKGMKWTLKVTV